MSQTEHHSSTDKRCKTSGLEQQILAQLAELGLDLVPQVKRKSWVFDAAVQGTKIFIEINGAYWHSLPEARQRDERKATWARQNGYTIIAIGEAEYEADPDGTLLKVVELVDQLREASGRDGRDNRDTEAPISSYTFDDWRDTFVQALAELGNVRHACIKAGVGRSTAYRHRDTDAEFAAAWDEALENFADLLEGVYAQRAIEQSDRAVEFLLKAIRRDKYTERSEVKTQVSGGLQLTAADLDTAAQEIHEWRAQQTSHLSSLLSASPMSATSPTPTE
ncbi:MAG: hypothetical protein OHK0022_27860 [Roseiflexaceae bacterium]